MQDRLKEILNRMKEWWDKYTTKQKTIFVGIAAVIVFTLIIIAYVMSRPKFTVLVTCDSAADASNVVKILDGQGIAHQESTNGLVISVDSSKLSDANLALGSEGILPDDYSVRDALGSSMSTTASDKEKYYKEYMEKKLKNDFEALNAVKSAQVHLNIPDQNGTLLQSEKEASAFIQLDLNGTFTSTNAENLAKATATYLGNSTTANITIIDNDSNLLFAGGDDYSTAGIASSMQELQNQAESMVANQVKKVLYGTNQYDNVEVTSHLTMDYANYEETVSEYYANSDRTEGMIAHQETYESENESGGGGIPGTDSNGDDLSTYVYEGSDNSSSSTAEQVTDYLPNQSLVSKVTPAGAINYGTSSVSITALKYREVYEKDAKKQGLLDGMTWDEYKAANSQDVKMEVDEEFYSIVANATGMNIDKITIVAYETPIFYDKESVSVSWTNVLSIVMFIIILALLVIVVLRSMQFTTNVSEEEELSVENLLQSTPESELEDIDVETKSETRKLIEKFCDDNPELAAALLRNWLSEDW